MTNQREGRASGSLEDRLSHLIETADELCAGDERRRDVLLERGEAQGLRRGIAERAYDLAVEERLPPAYGIAVTAAGVSVQPLEGERSEVAEVNSGEPDWVDEPPPPAEAELERRLRQTFRRVRASLEDASTPRQAFTGFAREPDLEPFDY